MAMGRIDASTRGIGDMLRALAEGSAELLRAEVRLARMELGTAAAAVGKGTAMVAFAAVLALLGGLAVLAGLVLLIGDQWLPRDLYWMAAAIVMVVTGVLVMAFLKRGMDLIAPARLAPNETMTTLKEDKEWLKQRLTSGATSS